MASRFVVEHLNHLGIVAEVCREIGVADWLDQQMRATDVLRLTKVHRLVLHLLGPAYENCDLTFQETAQ
jgi:hypothetical protein